MRPLNLDILMKFVNQCSSDKTYFVIGIEFKEKKSKNAPKYFWMKFKKRSSLPYIAEYMTLIGDKSVLVTMHASSVDYQTIDYNGEKFPDWVLTYGNFSRTKEKTLNYTIF